jgi:hypothetical protein
MKLECPIVRDLYILYEENELSGEVREAVCRHLDECEDCRSVYESESNFTDILKKDPDKQPSKKLDEKMMLRLKVSRLRIALAFIAAVFLITLYFNYSQSRRNLLYDVSMGEQALYKISFKIDNIKNDNAPIASFSEDIETLNNMQNNAIMRDLNIVEKEQLKKSSKNLFIDFKINDLYYMLKKRHMNGTFTDRDEKAAAALKQYMQDISKSMSDERMKLNKLYDGGKLQSLVMPINIKNIAEDYDKLNQLALLYTRYNKFPEELTSMSQTDIKARLKSIFNFDNPDIKIYPDMKASIRLNGDCTFDIKQGSLNYHGEIDAYTGNIISILSNSPDKSGVLLPLDGVKENLREFLGKNYGNEQRFDIKDVGINYHFSSNTDMKLYSFIVHPVINGLKVGSELWIYYNARTGDLQSVTWISGNNFIKPDYTVDTTVKVSPEEGLKNLELTSKEKYSYDQTTIIKSLLSGKYVLVHVYKYETNTAYINTITGKQEFVH